jgi:hypothetical protein
MTYRIRLRRSTAAQWTAANPVLFAGEAGFETDTGKLKIGDGTSAWSALYYFVNTGSSTLNDIGDVTITSASAGQGLVYNGSAWVNKATTFTFTQSSASAEWTIAHNLGYRPGGVAVVDSGENVVLGDIVHSSDNQLVINFSSAFAGKAYLS